MISMICVWDFGIFVFVSLGLWIVMRLCLWFWVVVNCDSGLSIIGRGPRDPKAGLGANKKTRLEPNLLPFLTPADFPILRDLRRLTFGFSFSKASRFHLFRPTFWLLFPLSFSQVSWFLPSKLKDPQSSSFMVHLPGFPEVPDPYSWVVGPQIFWSLLCIIGWLIGTYLCLFFVFLGMPPWTVLVPT